MPFKSIWLPIFVSDNRYEALSWLGMEFDEQIACDGQICPLNMIQNFV